MSSHDVCGDYLVRADGSPSNRIACRALCAALVLALLSACGSGGTTESAAAGVTTFAVGGTVTGLNGSGLVLQDNGGDNLSVTANGPFAFSNALIGGNSYNVSVRTQPNSPTQTCVTTNGSGTISDANITSVAIVCMEKTAPRDSIGGTVTGLVGSGLVLRNNGADDLSISSGGAFTFSTSLQSGLPFNVTVFSPPINPYQNCAVVRGSGATTGSDVTDVLVSCAVNSNETHTISGQVTGVSGNGTLVLQNNGRDDFAISADGPFTFTTPIPSGSSYSVSLSSKTAGGSQSQTCSFTKASGIVGGSDITDILVACKANLRLHVAVTGVAGSGLVLQNNGADNLSIAGDNTYAFATSPAAGDGYDVKILSQPANPSQTCIVSHGTGTAGTPGPGPSVACTTNLYKISGTVSGLAGTGLVLRNNGTDDLAISANGTFTFAASVASGSKYSLTVTSQPKVLTQLCTVTNGSGTIGAAAISNVSVDCVTRTFAVGGTISGLPDIDPAATVQLVLQNNSVDDVAILPTVTSPYKFSFPTPLQSGSQYSVSIKSQPGVDTSYGVPGVVQTSTVCTVLDGKGTVADANVVSVTIKCVNNPIGFAYVTNVDDNSITTYVIDGDTGTLVQFGDPTPTASRPSAAIRYGGLSDLYVANQGANSLSHYVVEPNIGKPTLAETVTGLNAPASLETSGSTLYVTNYLGDSVSAFSTGAQGLQSIPGSPFAAGRGPIAAAWYYVFSDFTRFDYYYVANSSANAISGYGINSATGFLTPLSVGPFQTGQSPSSLVTSGLSSNFAVYAANSADGTISGYTADTSGALTPIPGGPVAVGTGLQRLNHSYFGPYIYATSSQGVSAFQVNPSTGALTLVQGSPNAAGVGPGPIAAYGSYLYVVNSADGTVSIFWVDRGTGQLTPLEGANIKTGRGPTSIVIFSRPDYCNCG